MAVKIRIQKGQEPDPKKKVLLKIRPQNNVLLKVKKEDPPMQKDPAVKGPITFLNSYYDSNEFKRKSGSWYDANKSLYEAGANSYKVKHVDNSEEGSNAVSPVKIRESILFEKGKDPTIILDRGQAKKLNMNLENDVLPHEYTHTTRRLNLNDEEAFINKNKDPLILKKLYNEYLQKESTEMTGKNFSEWSRDILTHEQRPNENHADLNALRYLLYKNNIYDARKGTLTKEQLQKAIESPGLKDNFILKRLLKSFSIDDLVHLNNTIAMSDTSSSSKPPLA